ncbi:MAG: Hsp20/alpha crystallin family protein [Gemmatimonadota bacterium]|nr:Hsp20/alpha crystallin family protein [Gemmatimonadota bacterium]
MEDDTQRERTSGPERDSGTDGNGETTGAEGRDDTGAARPRPLDEIQGFVEDVLENVRAFAPAAAGKGPRIEVAESSDALHVQIDLPGVPRDAVDVSALDEELRVRGRRPRPDYPDGAVVRRSERSYGEFHRTLKIPGWVDADGIRARLENGVLELRLPRRSETGEHRVTIE